MVKGVGKQHIIFNTKWISKTKNLWQKFNKKLNIKITQMIIVIKKRPCDILVPCNLGCYYKVGIWSLIPYNSVAPMVPSDSQPPYCRKSPSVTFRHKHVHFSQSHFYTHWRPFLILQSVRCFRWWMNAHSTYRQVIFTAMPRLSGCTVAKKQPYQYFVINIFNPLLAQVVGIPVSRRTAYNRQQC